MSPVSLKDIARQLGISSAAVSKALNNLPGISDTLRMKVRTMAEAAGYQKHLQGRRAGRASGMKFIVVLYGRIGGHLIDEIQLATDPEIRRRGYHEIRYLIDITKDLLSQDKKDLLVETIFREPGVVGVLACYIKLSDVHISRLQERGIGVVLLENETEFGRCVTIDNYKASRKAVRHLITLNRKRIGCIMPQEDTDHVWKARLDGYRKALKEKGIPYDPSLIVYENVFDMEEAGKATLQLLRHKSRVDAILYGSDLQAYGGLKALRTEKVNVPKNVAVIGFDDMPFNTVVEPTLSSVRQPIGKMAQTGIRLLFDSIEKEDYSHRTIRLDAELVLRESCPALSPRRRSRSIARRPSAITAVDVARPTA